MASLRHSDQGASGGIVRRMSDPRLVERLSTGPERADVLVIGYGNTLRQDDGLGPIVADRLSALLTTEYSTLVVTTHQLTFDLAELVSRARCVMLVDAASGDTPGKITCQRIEPQGNQPHSMNHHMAAEALLASSLVLYAVAPPTYLWTVAGEWFDYGEALSPAVEQALPELIERLVNFISAEVNF